MNSKELILLRHGKSDWRVDCDDFDRPLKKRGKLGAMRIGTYIKEQLDPPQRVLSSPAERARNTAEKCIKAMGSSVAGITFDKRLYESDALTLLNVLQQQEDTIQSLMLVGHNPGLEDLLFYLCKTNPPIADDGKILPTATIARLRLHINSWKSLEEACGQLEEIVRAKELGPLFPAYKNGKTIFRERPDYYYRQSAVIPYRKSDQELEILLVGSSSKNRWTLPKGIVEPGLSPQQSAKKEALEEAGIRGEIHHKRLGIVDVKKWGDVCSVELYLMRVDTVLSEDLWCEKHRGRQWLSPAEAAKRISNSDYAPYILSLKESLAHA